MNDKIFVDTNVLLNQKFNFNNYSRIYISIVSIEELDKLKRDERISYQARQAIKNIKSADNVEIIIKNDINTANILFLEHSNDNAILNMAYDVFIDDNEVLFLTDDYNLFVKADKGLKLPCKMFEFDDGNSDEIYTGYKEVTLSMEELAEHYQNPINRWDLLNNEYLIIRDENGNVVDKQKWNDNKGFSTLSYKQIDNMYTCKIKPRNIQQELAFDLFQNKNITVKCIYGKYGSGKDIIKSLPEPCLPNTTFTVIFLF